MSYRILFHVARYNFWAVPRVLDWCLVFFSVGGYRFVFDIKIFLWGFPFSCFLIVFFLIFHLCDSGLGDVEYHWVVFCFPLVVSLAVFVLKRKGG